MIKEKMKQVRTARLCHSRWKRGCDVIVAAADAAKALKAADAGAAKKAKDDAAAKKVKDDANEEALHNRGILVRHIFGRGLQMSAECPKAMKAMKNSKMDQ